MVLLLMLLLLLALVAIYLLRLPPEQHHPWHEAALIAVLLCAPSLGEAFCGALGVGHRAGSETRDQSHGTGGVSTEMTARTVSSDTTLSITFASTTARWVEASHAIRMVALLARQAGER
jgi:hypothetical protein